MAYHLRGIVVPDGEERDLYVVGDRITFEPLTRAETVVDGGWLLPGLVDVHTHPGAEHPGDPLDEALLRQHGSQHRDAGVTLLRVPGSAARLPARVDGIVLCLAGVAYTAGIVWTRCSARPSLFSARRAWSNRLVWSSSVRIE